jgi:hypothetical protein
MTLYQTSINSDTGQMTVWPTKVVHEVHVDVRGRTLLILVDIVIADLPDKSHANADARFLLCGVHPTVDGPDSRITGFEVPFVELPQPLRDEIVAELSRIAGI